MVAKIHYPEDIAMETVTHLFFVMSNISAGGQAIVLKFWQCVLVNESYNSCSEHNIITSIHFLNFEMTQNRE